MTPNVIGVDLSITATGICHSNGSCETVGGKASDGDHRICSITERVMSAVMREDPLPLHIPGEWDIWRVELVVIEGLAIHGPGGAMAAAQLMGALKLCLIEGGVAYVEVPPATLKKFATGKGNATKTDMAIAALKRAGVEFADDNQCDAWWLRQAGLHALGHPQFDLPQAQVDALAKVTWPNIEQE